MTPREYLDDVCRPNFEEFVQEPTSIRRAWAAAAALYHFQDCLAVHRAQRLSLVRNELEAAFPQFTALANIANASKHFELDKGPRAGLAAQHFKIGRGAAFSDGSYYSDGTTHSDAPDVIRVEFMGERIDVLNLCRLALQYLESKA